MMGHIPADREWVGSSEAVAVEESTDNKGEAVDKCKFTVGFGKKCSVAEKQRFQQRGRAGGAAADEQLRCTA